MIVVHHLRQSRSQRIPWLLEELGLEYRIVDHPRRGGLAPPELKAVHPLGKAPVIEDEGRVLAESGAIIEYLLERYGDGRLGPGPGEQARRDWQYWMHYAEGSLMPLVVLGIVLDRMARAPWPVRPVARLLVGRVRASYLDPGLETHLDWVERTLAQRPWFGGEAFGAVDVHMSLPLEALSRDSRAAAARPAIGAFLERVRARPAYRRAMARMEQARAH